MSRFRRITFSLLWLLTPLNAIDYVHSQGLDDFYKLGPDSLAQEGVPKGTISDAQVLPCQAYPGTQHTFWVYVPAQYDPSAPCSLMIFQDGQAFMHAEGSLRAQHVMDNLIHRR